MPVYELMRKNERVTLMALNQSGGIEKCDYKNINRRIAPLQEQICVDGFSAVGKNGSSIESGKSNIFWNSRESSIQKNIWLRILDLV